MNAILSWWARNSVAANLLMIFIIIGGVVGYLRIEREVQPTVSFPGAAISVYWPGASPQDVEQQIVVRIEEALGEIEGIDQLWAVSNESAGEVYVVARNGVDRREFMDLVRSKVAAIPTLPDAAEQPIVNEFNNREEIMRLAVYGDVDERLLARTAERVRRDVARQPGVSIVELFGDRREEVSIEVSEEALRRYELSFADVANAVRAASFNASAGEVRTTLGDVPLATRNLADTESDFADIIVRQTADGAAIRVRDVASIRDGFEDVQFLATVNGEPAVLVQIMSGDNMDLPKTSRSVLAYLEDVKAKLPPGISVTVWENQAEAYNDRMSLLFNNFFSGVALVIIILFLFLRPVIAFWAAFGIVVSFAGCIALLPMLGVSFNMISTFAFLLMTGVIVDDAIIVGEAIHSRTERGESHLTAALAGTQFVLKPVFFAALTTMVFFAPWMFLSGGTSEFTRAISLVVILSLAFSLVEALCILPGHLSHMVPIEETRGLARVRRRIAQSLVWASVHLYRPIMDASIRHRYLTAAIFIASMIVSVGLVTTGWVKFSFMPDIEGDQISINVRLPEGVPYERSLQVLEQIQVAEEQLVAEVAESGKTIVENWYTRVRENDVLALVKLSPPEDRAMSSKEAADRLRELIGEVPDAESTRVEFSLNSQGPPLEFLLHSEDFDELRVAAEELKDKLRTFDDVTNVVDDMEAATDEVRINLLPGAETMGLTLADVTRQVRQGFYGEEVQRLPRDGEDVRVFVRYPRDDRKSMEQLESMRVRTLDGREIPLSSAAELTYEPGVKFILRRDRQRAVVVSAEAPSEIVGDVRRELDEGFWTDFDANHPGITRGMIGQAEGEREFMMEFLTLTGICVAGAYFLVAIAFRSYSQPLLMLFAAIPFCVMGAILGHFFMGQTMSIFSILGISAAAGVAVNDNLVLIDVVNRLREKGMGGGRALLEGGTDRFRAMFLTSLTTFVGLAPLMFEQSIQAKFLVPIAIGLAWGTAFALPVSLFFVPALYAIGADLRRHVIGAWTGKPQPRFGSSLDEPAPDRDIVDATLNPAE